MENGRTRRPLVPIGILMMVVGVIAGVALAAVVAVRAEPAFYNAFVRAPMTAPVQTSLRLVPGEWAVYVAEQAVPVGGTTQAAFARSVPALSSLQFAVTDPAGHVVNVQDWSATTTDTIDRQGVTYVTELYFTAAMTGDYQVSVTGNDGTQFLIAPVLSDIGRYVSVGGLVGVFGSGLLFLLGLVLLIVGIVSGRRQVAPAAAPWPPGQVSAPVQPQWVPQPPAAQPQPGPQPPASPVWPSQPYASPPAGWYQDPARAASWRYWDGQAWTSHTA